MTEQFAKLTYGKIYV